MLTVSAAAVPCHPCQCQGLRECFTDQSYNKISCNASIKQCLRRTRINVKNVPTDEVTGFCDGGPVLFDSCSPPILHYSTSTFSIQACQKSKVYFNLDKNYTHSIFGVFITNLDCLILLKKNHKTIFTILIKNVK